MSTYRHYFKGIASWLMRVVAYGAAAGLLVYLVIFGARLDLQGLVWCLSAGLCYSAVMLTGIEMAIRLMDRRRPMQSRADILPRVLVVTATAIASFILATYVAEIVLGFRLFGAGSTFMLTAVVALAVTAVGSSLYFLEAYRRRLRAAEHAAVQAELQTLRAQINPHFLFNALNSIAALIRMSPADAEEVTESLADLFRYSLRASSQPTVALLEEAESVELYLTIERARFGERLRTRVGLPEELRSARVPSLLLQPLVENAVKHGVARTHSTCTVSVEIEPWRDSVRITVSDDGPGFPAKPLDELLAAGHGLSNVRDRLRLQFGNAARISIHRNAVELTFPLQQAFPEGAVADHLLHR